MSSKTQVSKTDGASPTNQSGEASGGVHQKPSESVLRKRREIAEGHSAFPSSNQRQPHHHHGNASQQSNITTLPTPTKNTSGSSDQKAKCSGGPAASGDTVGNYVIDREVGRGQFAVVYRAIPMQQEEGGRTTDDELSIESTCAMWGATSSSLSAIALKIDLLPERQLGARAILDDQQTNRNWMRVMREFAVVPPPDNSSHISATPTRTTDSDSPSNNASASSTSDRTPMQLNHWTPSPSALSPSSSSPLGSPKGMPLWRNLSGTPKVPSMESPVVESPPLLVLPIPPTTPTNRIGFGPNDTTNNDDVEMPSGLSGGESLGASTSGFGNSAATLSPKKRLTDQSFPPSSSQQPQAQRPQQPSVDFFQYHPRQSRPATAHIVRYFGDKLRTAGGHRVVELELLDSSQGDIKQTLAGLKHRRFTEANTRALVFQMLIAVAHCHRHRVAHRDIKPANLLHDGNGLIKLGDFGLSVHVPQPQPTVAKKGFDLSVPRGKVRSAAGTPTFMPPEAFEVDSRVGYDPFAADIWSVGVSMYVCVTGRLPFIAKDYGGLVKAVNEGVYPAPKRLSATGIDLLTKLLTAAPLQRLSAMQALHHPWFNPTTSLKPAQQLHSNHASSSGMMSTPGTAAAHIPGSSSFSERNCDVPSALPISAAASTGPFHLESNPHNPQVFQPSEQ